ncbi:MAG: MCE family protein [Bacteroidetes bacterium]|nr:MCE family protein [Bacteroidota bacterium]
MNRYKQIVIGASFILAIALFIWGYNFLKGNDIFNNQTIYYAKYHEVSGLEVSNPVVINGMRIGQVSAMKFDPSMSGDIIVELWIYDNFPIPENSIARIFSSDLMGSKAVDIKLGNSPDLAMDSDTLATSIEASLMEEVNAQVQPIKAKAENLLASIDTLVTAFQTIFNESARKNLRESFDNLNQSFSNIQSATTTLDTLMITEGDRVSSILMNVDSLAYSLSNNREKFSNIIANFEAISDSLAKADIPGTFNRANSTLDELEMIVAKINEGEGTIGMLMHNDTLYMELNKSAEELNLLLKDIRENPKRYVKFSLF